MKKRTKVLAAVVLLCATNAVSFCVGSNYYNNDDYQSASILSDICHRHLDACDADSVDCGFKELYYSTLEELDLWYIDVPREKLEHYAWAY